MEGDLRRGVAFWFPSGDTMEVNNLSTFPASSSSSSSSLSSFRYSATFQMLRGSVQLAELWVGHWGGET